MKVSIPTQLTIDRYEEFIARIAAQPDGAELDLELPVLTKYSLFGGWACAIQAVNTWGRKSSTRRVLLRREKISKDATIASAIKRPHKFCATMIARSIEDASTGEQLRPLVNAFARNAVDEQASSPTGLALGPLRWFVFVDHSTRGFDRNFYIESPDRQPQPRQLMQISEVISSIVKRSLTQASRRNRLDSREVDHLGRLFYELFLNTHEHGTRGKYKSDWLAPGLRVVYANGINLSRSNVDSSLVSMPVLGEYVDSLKLDARRVGFVEISIVDSGLGFCGRWLADRSCTDAQILPSIDAEYEIFKKCFSFRQTSTDSSTKGNGLPVVMDRLTRLQGFMRVRSGRLSLYRNFVTRPFTGAGDCEFFDWITCQPALKQTTPMSPVSGVALTLLIPVGASYE